MSGRAGIVSLATAVPGHAYGQAQLADWLCEHFGYPERLARFVRRLHERSAIARRHSVLADFEPGRRPRLFRDPRACDIEVRMAVYAEEAPRLAAQACTKALADAGLAADQVTHLVVVTSTGFMTPGPDVHVAQALGLRRSVERVVVAMHGCAGGTVGIGVASRIARDDAEARVLLVAVEICSIHLGSGAGREVMVANSLFADGAAAAVIRGVERGEACEVALGERRTSLLPDSQGLLTWRLLPTGFELRLAREIPRRLRAAVGQFVGSPCGPDEARNERLASICSWAVHPGGPGILEAIREGLGLASDDLGSSYSVLRENGNVSSASVLFALRSEIDRSRPQCGVGRRGLMMSFGPGMCIDTIDYSLGGS